MKKKKKYKNWRTFTPANEQVAENISLFTFCSHCESSIFFSLCEQTGFQMIGTLSKSWCCFSILHLSLSLPEASQSNIGLFEFGDNLFFPLFFCEWTWVSIIDESKSILVGEKVYFQIYLDQVAVNLASKG